MRQAAAFISFSFLAARRKLRLKNGKLKRLQPMRVTAGGRWLQQQPGYPRAGACTREPALSNELTCT